MNVQNFDHKDCQVYEIIDSEVITLLVFVAVSAGIAPHGDDDQQLCEQLRAQGAAPTQPAMPTVKL